MKRKVKYKTFLEANCMTTNKQLHISKASSSKHAISSTTSAKRKFFPSRIELNYFFEVNHMLTIKKKKLRAFTLSKWYILKPNNFVKTL